MDATVRQLLEMKNLSAPPRVLLCAAECSPLSKTGGLADVAGALPKAMGALGCDMRVITPYHRCIKEKYAERTVHMCDFELSLGWRRQYVGLERLEIDGLTVYLVDNEFYFGDRIYLGGEREGEQYAFFQRAVLECIPRLDFSPEVLHCNDWHTAMLPFLIKAQYQNAPQGALKTVLTIHNIAFQGRFGFDFVSDLLGVGREWYTPSGIEHNGCVNFLKAGCLFADRVTTVSPSYAREILTPEFGEGLEGVLLSRGSDLTGIINGIDTSVFDPETDPALAFRFSLSGLNRRCENKPALCRELGLEYSENTPLLAMVTRMTAQKGFDLVMDCFDRLMSLGASFVLLGTGDERYESFMREAERRYPGRVCSYLAYDEALAHRIYASADIFLMPSRFEPCGLSQMIAMRYGALPLVHEVGGLRDTVTPYNCFTGEGTGFSFHDFEPDVFISVAAYALEAWRDEAVRDALMRSAMSVDFGFGPSALEYLKLFVGILPESTLSARHEPELGRFRSPLGAVKCGETVRLRIDTDGSCLSAVLCAGDERIAMERVSGGFEASYTAPDIPQVVWYYFELNSSLTLGETGVQNRSPQPFQLTVYDSAFETPNWAKGAVMYQIFPDRYRREGASYKKGLAYHRALGREMTLHSSWDEPVKWDGGKSYRPDDFYGGTFLGIEKSLPEIKALGADIIYLNPIFESDSNHRYNTADYLKADPILGTNAAFRRLCKKASELGIRIILDGVFSHTGDDSVYFNRYSRYPEPGAYESRESKYYPWYDFRSFPDDYRCWWGFRSLPEVNETDPDWEDFVISGEGSVIRTWLGNGARGYRLDVADELPDSVLDKMRTCVKAADPSALIIGEVWEDATTKISYGEKRRYALGTALDSVMNYPLRSALIDFALGRSDAHALCRFLVSQKLSYPRPMYHCLMNMLSTHDTARIRTVLGSGRSGEGMTRSEQAAFSLDGEQDARGRRLQQLCESIIFSLPGMPSVYYGDEEGMQGFRDPFCRAPYRKGDPAEREFISGLAGLRRKSPVLGFGDAAFFAPDGDTICILRFLGKKAALCCATRSESPSALTLSPLDFLGAEEKALLALPEIPPIEPKPVSALILPLRAKK